MWPKALAQLIELAPHITRLLPLADRFLKDKTATEDASRRAMDAMAEGLRGDLGQVTAAHAGLYRQLSDQSEKLDLLAADTRSAREATDALALRLTQAEATAKRLTTLAIATLVLLIVCAVMLLLLLQHQHANAKLAAELERPETRAGLLHLQTKESVAPTSERP